MILLTVNFGTPPYTLKSATLPSGLTATLVGDKVHIEGMYTAAGEPAGYVPRNFVVRVEVEDSSTPKLQGEFVEAIQIKTRDWNWTYTSDMEVTIDTQNGSNFYYNEPSQLEIPYMGEDSATSPNFSLVSAPSGWVFLHDIHTHFMGLRGTISGAGKGVGTSFMETVSIRASDGGIPYDRIYTEQVEIQVRVPELFPSDYLFDATLNQAYSGAIFISGGNGRISSITSSSIPQGLNASVDNTHPQRSRILIQGTPTQVGSHTMSFDLTDTEGNVWLNNTCSLTVVN